MDKEITKVIFRTWINERCNSDVTAIFPEIAASYIDPCFCACYEIIGQHSDCLPSRVRNKTRPSTQDEIAPIRTELEKIGYKLQPILRMRYRHLQERERQIRELRI